ncbi:MAG: fluoride efflux transporter CrcB [Terriglobales bacterium]
MLIAAIAIAGALGALSRWGLGQLMLKWVGPAFPYGTLSANLIGCFMLGLVMELGERAVWMNAEVRIAISVGFIGALTTFSTWEFETFRMARRGDMLLAAGNFAVNIIFGFVLIWAGGRLVAGILR